jgi:hypothetical protein
VHGQRRTAATVWKLAALCAAGGHGLHFYAVWRTRTMEGESSQHSDLHALTAEIDAKRLQLTKSQLKKLRKKRSSLAKQVGGRRDQAGGGCGGLHGARSCCPAGTTRRPTPPRCPHTTGGQQRSGRTSLQATQAVG